MRINTVIHMAALATACAFSACDNGTKTPAMGSGGTAGQSNAQLGGVPAGGAALTAGTAGAHGAVTNLSDAQVLHVMDTANTGEVAEAQIAADRAQSTAVRNFAQMMIANHSAAKDKGNTLAASTQLTPADNPVSQALRVETDAVTARLNAASSADFDRIYMDTQVTAHQKVLALVNANLLPSAQRAEIDALLSEMRTQVAAHLTQAQSILSALP